eukprot:7566840-Pyramimonas_sp.AAC.1
MVAHPRRALRSVATPSAVDPGHLDAGICFVAQDPSDGLHEQQWRSADSHGPWRRHCDGVPSIPCCAPSSAAFRRAACSASGRARTPSPGSGYVNDCATQGAKLT